MLFISTQDTCKACSQVTVWGYARTHPLTLQLFSFPAAPAATHGSLCTFISASPQLFWTCRQCFRDLLQNMEWSSMHQVTKTSKPREKQSRQRRLRQRVNLGLELLRETENTWENTIWSFRFERDWNVPRIHGSMSTAVYKSLKISSFSKAAAVLFSGYSTRVHALLYTNVKHERL